MLVRHCGMVMPTTGSARLHGSGWLHALTCSHLCGALHSGSLFAFLSTTRDKKYLATITHSGNLAFSFFFILHLLPVSAHCALPLDLLCFWRGRFVGATIPLHSDVANECEESCYHVLLAPCDRRCIGFGRCSSVSCQQASHYQVTRL